jgi:hypothetical protein
LNTNQECKVLDNDVWHTVTLKRISAVKFQTDSFCLKPNNFTTARINVAALWVADDNSNRREIYRYTERNNEETNESNVSNGT